MKKIVNGSLAVILILLVVLSFNTFVSALTERFGLRFDLTQGQLFRLSDTTKEVLRNLGQTVTITYFDEEDGSDTNVSELLKRYEKTTDRIVLRYIDLEANPAMVTDYGERGIKLTQNGILVESGENAAAFPWNEMYGYNTYRDADGNVRYTLTSFKAEKKITSAIAQVTGEKPKTVFLTQGHGENAGGRLKELIGDSRYTVREGVLGMTGMEDVSTVLIAGPDRDFSGEEIELLDGFLNSGGSLIMLRNPRAGTLEHLDAYMAEWGLGADGTLVLEPSRQMDSPVNVIPDFSVHMMNVYFSEASSYVVLPMCGSLTLTNPGGRLTAPVLTSTSSSYAKALEEAATLEREEGDLQGPFILAATSEKKVDAKEGEERKALVFMTDCSGFYEDKWLSNTALGNGQLILQALSYMNNETVTLEVPEKTLSNTQIAISWSATVAIGVLFLGIIPAGLILTGLIVFVRRRTA